MGIPSGSDLIGDFDYGSGDRIQVSSTITQSNVADSTGGAVITFSNGATVTLTGVQASSVSDAWFIA